VDRPNGSRSHTVHERTDGKNTVARMSEAYPGTISRPSTPLPDFAHPGYEETNGK
jgi:hypothetical protein